jgi:undecaprenyl-diphosphatase
MSTTLVISIIAVFLLSILVYFFPVLTFDIGFSKDLQSEPNSPVRHFFVLYVLKAVSFLGVPVVAIWIVLGFALLFWLLKYYWENLFCLLTLIAPVINSIVKFIVHRPRPSSNYVLIFDKELSPSFPSGHVVFYTVFFGFLIVAMHFSKKIPMIIRYLIAFFSVILIITVSISRIYLGAHWLTDVVGGYFLGIIILSVLLFFYLKPYYKEFKKDLEKDPS